MDKIINIDNQQIVFDSEVMNIENFQGCVGQEIISIEKIDENHPQYEYFAGYKISTKNNVHIYYLIDDNEICCCERWGCICTSNNIKDLIGAKINLITDTQEVAIDEELLKTNSSYDQRSFLAIQTTKGTLQLFAYVNEFDGICSFRYEGSHHHRVVIKITKQILEEK